MAMISDSHRGCDAWFWQWALIFGTVMLGQWLYICLGSRGHREALSKIGKVYFKYLSLGGGRGGEGGTFQTPEILWAGPQKV